MVNVLSNKHANCYVIAEAGLNHNGSISLAKELIDVAHNSGANAVKFQKRTVKNLATQDVLNTKDKENIERLKKSLSIE